PVETTELPKVNEATTIIPAQIEESSPTQTLTNQNETITSAHPVESPKAEATDPAAFVVQSSETEVQDSFVSVYGGTLEQDIKNDVNSEVEEAPSPAETLKETVSQVAEVAAVETENRETETAVQNAREPKTLETQEAEGTKPADEDQAEPEAGTDNIAVASEQVESRSQDNPDSLSLNENQAITEQPITKTNLLALEQELKAVEVESTGTPVPIYEETKHQVTKKQGVEDLLPIEPAPEVVDEPEIAREERQFEEHNPNLNEIDGNPSEDGKATVNTFEKSAGELQEEIEKKTEEEAMTELEKEVEGTAPPQETVVEAADAEDSQPGEEDAILGAATEKSVSEESKPIVEEAKDDENKEEEIKDEQLKEEELKEEEHQEEEPMEEEPKGEEPKEEEDNEKNSQSSEPKEDGSNSDSSEETHEPAADEAKPSSSDDSTATPLVSYPPHDAGQTFDSNSADEHSAQLSGPSNYRSTLIIALCSGTAVIFIVASLVIFVVSFQRQHGTLDIEMQEQRLGKDDRDEEDAQVKLLEVDLSTPVIVSLGNEETDECL
ncbi:hypothetical protein KR032_009604, partial [Drosophila birchii]